MRSTEAQARSRIDQQLRAAGWDPTDGGQVLQEVTLSDGTRADYALRDSLGRSLAPIEAKKSIINAPDAREQGRHYAKVLGTPFVFLANGNDIWFWQHEFAAHPHKIRTFFSRADLERMAASLAHRRDLLSVPIDTKIAGGGGRQFQLDCLETLSRHVAQGRRKLLVEMATGTGKTRTAAALIKRLFEAGYVTRVLFLVDRINLATQAEKEFADTIPEFPCYVLKKGRFRDEKLITVTTLQSMIGIYQDYTSGYFDLVFTDECHRSIYGKWKSALTYFDGIQIGLTATPCVAADADRVAAEEDKAFVRDTLRFFECDKPHFVYGIREAIKDKHLVGYNIYKAKTSITAAGVTVTRQDLDHPDNDPKVIGELFGDADTITVAPLALERKFIIPERNRAIVREFREVLEKGYTDKNGKRHKPMDGKTIVFAVTKKHAQTLAHIFDDVFADRKPAPNVAYADYVVSGQEIDDRKGVNPDTIIQRFKTQEFPKILVSVGMLDTGFNCPEVVNLVMARFTRSAILYQQMRGRGTRRCTFADGTEKTGFTIFDFVGVTDFFNDDDEHPTGGIYVVRESRPKPQPRQVLVLDVHDAIDPTTRDWIEIGETGEVIDRRSYLEEAAAVVQEEKNAPDVQRVLQTGDFADDEERRRFEERLNRPRLYLKLSDLREALNNPRLTWEKFLRHVLQGTPLPTYEDLLDEAFQSWTASQPEPFTEEQIRILTMMKNQFACNRDLIREFSMERFNRPPFQASGGLAKVRSLFGNRIEDLLEELNTQVFAP